MSPPGPAPRPAAARTGRAIDAGVTHSTAVILEHKQYDAPSVFVPEHLLREARRQKATLPGPVPSICVLDPDGDIVRHMIARHQARLSPSWACYHTQLYQVEHAGTELGIIGCAVGAPFAVLVAEELFASGCELLISVTSAGLIRSDADPPFFIVIDRALRDEGTSYHYLPPSDYAHIDDDKYVDDGRAVSRDSRCDRLRGLRGHRGGRDGGRRPLCIRSSAR